MAPNGTAWIKGIVLFLILLVVLTGGAQLLVLSTFAPAFGRLMMWAPGGAALLTLLILKRKLSSLGWDWGKPGFLLQSYLLPLGYVLAAYLVIWGIGGGTFFDPAYVSDAAGWYHLMDSPAWIVIPVLFLIEGTTGFMFSVATALGEEIGWRGFLVPELAKRYSFFGVAFGSGIIWALWHYPLYIAPHLSGGVSHIEWKLVFFTSTVVAISFPLAYLRLKSGSLWTAVFFHASHNLFLQSIFTPLTLANEDSWRYLDETGAPLAGATLVLAFYYWRKGKKEFG